MDLFNKIIVHTLTRLLSICFPFRLKLKLFSTAMTLLKSWPYIFILNNMETYLQ